MRIRARVLHISVTVSMGDAAEGRGLTLSRPEELPDEDPGLYLMTPLRAKDRRSMPYPVFPRTSKYLFYRL